MSGGFDFVPQLVADAGGQITGRTRLQKIAYLLHAAGLEDSFRFEYKHYGPFSEGLSEATQVACLFGDIDQEERATGWGGSYYVFKGAVDKKSHDARRLELIAISSHADAVELELAATAVFLAKQGINDPWNETQRRKPEKAAKGGLTRAKALYKRLQALPLPSPLPPI